MIRPIVLSVLVGALTLATPTYTLPARAFPRAVPQLMLWAWERPEDLRGLGSRTGVAFLTQTITLSSDSFSVRPRQQPLRVDHETTLAAVTRVEVRRSTAPAGSTVDVEEVASVIARTGRLQQVAVVQVDFDAVASERPFYRKLIERLRAQLDPHVGLSITALASWCVGDDWLAGLPIDEAVPMLFEMGPVNEPYRRLALDQSRTRRECRGAVGWSIDEPIAILARDRRVYVFNAKPWTPFTIGEAHREVSRWD